VPHSGHFGFSSLYIKFLSGRAGRIPFAGHQAGRQGHKQQKRAGVVNGLFFMLF
jgi:hypothetical protein